MNKIDERITQITEVAKDDRRNFLKRIYKYAIGLSAFGFASLFGLKRDGEIRFGKMTDTEIGLSEAQGACSYGSNCAGGGGQCSYGSSCGGSGGGSGQCSYGSSCAGGGGSCSYGSNCAGGGGQCSYGSNCAGN